MTEIKDLGFGVIEIFDKDTQYAPAQSIKIGNNTYIREDLINKQIADLQSQLAEKDKEYKSKLKEMDNEYKKERRTFEEDCKHLYKTPTSKAIEQLEKVKELCKTKFEWWENSEWEGNIYDKSDVSNAYFDIEANIDQQIALLKGENK